MFSAMRGHPPEPGALMSAAEALEGRDPEDGFVVQNPWGCEQRFRWDIQTCAPDMLVTNLSLLSVLLHEPPLKMEDFDQTLAYLEDDDARFHLVLDELHLYRGSAGAETAFSLRIILTIEAPPWTEIPRQAAHPCLKRIA